MIEIAPDGCWLWTGGLDQDGYGKFWLDGKTLRAHRAVYQLIYGIELDSETLHHKCRTRRCVNPDHLKPATQAENQAERRTCECGRCKKCRRREYMREWSRQNAPIVRLRVSRYRKLKRASASISDGLQQQREAA